MDGDVDPELSDYLRAVGFQVEMAPRDNPDVIQNDVALLRLHERNAASWYVTTNIVTEQPNCVSSLKFITGVVTSSPLAVTAVNPCFWRWARF